MSELSLTELDAQHTELLPEREALGVHGSFNHAHISIHQSNTQIQVSGVPRRRDRCQLGQCR